MENNKELSQVTSLPTFNEAQINIITGKTPKNRVKSRMGRGGKTVNYVEVGWVQEQLNEAFHYAWDWKIVDKQIGVDQVWVQGELTVYLAKDFSITKTGFGGTDITKQSGRIVDIGDSLKSAAADALKKAASQLGIAKDVYWKDADVTPQEPVTNKETALDMLRINTMRRFFITASERGFSEIQAKMLIKKKYKVEHMEELAVSQMNETIESLITKYQNVGRGNSPLLLTTGVTDQNNQTIAEAKLPEEANLKQAKTAIRFCANQTCKNQLSEGYKYDICSSCRMQEFIQLGKKKKEQEEKAQQVGISV